jgi:capsule polysaccharide export protein KpsE/RkpR
MKSVDENVACLLGFSPNYMSQTNISAPLLPQAQGNNTAGTSDDRELFARTEVQKASARLDVAAASLTAAEADLRSHRTANATDVTSPLYSELKAEVARCTAVLAGAQRNYDNALNGGIG